MYITFILEQLAARFKELSTWQGIAVVVGCLVLFGVITHPTVVLLTKIALAVVGVYLIVKSR